MFSSSLRKHKPGFDGLAQSHFVGQQSASGKRGFEGKQCGIDLMRIKINLCIDKRGSNFLGAVRRESAGQFVGYKFCLIVS